jgi:hypothetical protein
MHSILGAWRSSWIGGGKTGDDRWYEKHVPLADKIYDEHLAALKKEDK